MATTPHRSHVAPQLNFRSFIYGWPDAINRRRPLDDQVPQLLCEAGEDIRDWTKLVPPEFARVIVETLLFDWFAVAHVSVGPNGQALPNPWITHRAALWQREHDLAVAIAAQRAARQSESHQGPASSPP